MSSRNNSDVCMIPRGGSSQNHETRVPIGLPSDSLAVHQWQGSYFHICNVKIRNKNMPLQKLATDTTAEETPEY